MATIDQISNGRVCTHIAGLLRKATDRVHSGKLAGLKEIFQDDPVYRAVAAGTFCLPVAACRDAAGVEVLACGFRTDLGREAERYRLFADRCEGLLRSYSGKWDADSYLIIPVIDQGQEPGLVYLVAPSIETGGRRLHSRLHIEDLTRDGSLLDYFDSLAVVLMKRFHYVTRYPLDVYEPLSGCAFRLLFGCQITEGKSMGAAVTAMFAITFLRESLGDQVFSEIANPQPALITGEVDDEGNILKVDDIRKKVGCALEEYGPALRVIIPADNPLEDLEQKIDKGNLFYVSNVDELLTALLDTDNDGAYERCRKGVFQRLSRKSRELLRPHLAPGVPADIYERPSARSEPVPRPFDVYSVCIAWGDRLDLSVAPDCLSAAHIVNPGEKTLIQVLLDGSHKMEEHWIDLEELGTSRAAAAVFRIKECLDAELEELVVGILGTGRFVAIDPLLNALQIADLLNSMRRVERAAHRGPFVRPLREASLRIYAGRSKRILLLTDGYVPDAADVADEAVAVEEQLGFIAGSDDDPDRFLFGPDGRLNQYALDRRFRRAAVSIPRVIVNVGAAAPLDVVPPGGVVLREGKGYTVTWENRRAVNWDIHLRLSGPAPHQVEVSADIIRGTVTHNSRFPALATRIPLPPIEGGSYCGELDDADAALWHAITAGVCDCKVTRVHLYHRQAGAIKPRPILSILRDPRADGKYLLLDSGTRQWVIFRQGCRSGGVNFAVIGGQLRWLATRLREEEVPLDQHEEGLYRLEHDGRTFFIAAP